MTELVVQIEPQKDWVDFAIIWMQVLRKFKEKLDFGEIESITYLRLKQDIEYIIQQVTETLLLETKITPI